MSTRGEDGLVNRNRKKDAKEEDKNVAERR